MRKALKIICVLHVTLLSLVLVTILIMYKMNIVLPWKVYPGHTSTITSKVDAERKIETDRLKPITLVFKDDLYELDVKQFLKVKATISIPSFKSWLFDDNLTYDCVYTYDTNALDKVLKDIKVKCEDAKIVLNSDGKFTISSEKQNRDFDIESAKKLLYESIENESFSVNIKDICNKPKVTTESLKKTFDEISWVNNFVITYTSGDSITASDLYDCWEADLTFNLDKINIDCVLDSLSAYYDTTNNSINFKSSMGNIVTVPYKTYGVSLDVDAELEYVKSLIGTHASVSNRIPYTKGYDNFTNTYIEVSIKDQHLWHYVNGTLCCESDIVTGTKGVHDTPVGVFYVSEMIPGKNLRGRDYVTWVNRWMRLTNTGIGLHDAYWRSNFGKSIYVYNGSHGCVNLPKNYAYKLYSEITRGIVVIIYDERN